MQLLAVSASRRPSPTTGTPKLGKIWCSSAREAVSNAVRHGRPGRVTVTLDYQDDALRLAVEDDGCGFEPGRPRARALRS